MKEAPEASPGVCGLGEGERDQGLAQEGQRI